MYYVYVSRVIRPYWKGFDNRISFMNVRINASGYDDKSFVNDIIAKGKDNV